MSDDERTLDRSATEALNRHGYSFSEAVSNAVYELGRTQNIGWWVDALEFPVSLGGADTHIDLLLRDAHGLTYVAVECKRVDPGIGRWLFARADTIISSMSTARVVFEDVQHSDAARTSHVVPYTTHIGDTPYHFGVEQRTPQKKGDGVGGQADAISKAVSQALKGAGGFIEHALQHGLANARGGFLRVVPAVVTTAELWTTDAVLGQASLLDGNLDPDSVEWKQTPWLWFNHNRSRSLQPRGANPASPGTLSQWLESFSTRSVAVVHAAHLESFLRYRLR